jgi:hypothetical protein
MSMCPKCQSNNTVQTQKGPHVGEYCADCSAFIRWVPQGLQNFIWPVGAKHKGKPILEILRTDRPYLEWAAENMTASPGLRKKALEALSTLSPTQSAPKALTSPDQVISAPQVKMTLPPLKRVLPPTQTQAQTLRPPSSDDRAPWED